MLDDASSTGSQPRSRRNEILLLRKCIPTTTELLRIMDSHPEEGERLSRYCALIETKIKELEVEHKETVLDAEQRKRDMAKARAQERYKAKKRYVVECFMDKNMNAEDRLAEQERCRAIERQKKEALEFASQRHAAEQRHSRQIARDTNAMERKCSWEAAVSSAERRREEERAQHLQKVHEEHLAFERRAAEFSEAARARQRALLEVSRSLEEKAAEHVARATQRKLQRKEAAARLASKPVAHPNVAHDTATVIRDKVRQRELAAKNSTAAALASRVACGAIQCAERAHRKEIADERIRKSEAMHTAKVRSLEEALNARLQQHGHRQQERRAHLEAVKERNHAKEERCRLAVSQRLEDGHAKLSEKLLDRTIRVGSALGIELPPLLPSGAVFITAQESKPAVPALTAGKHVDSPKLRKAKTPAPTAGSASVGVQVTPRKCETPVV